MATGFDCEFVKKPQDEFQSECPVCLHVLREPYQVSCCGHGFCHKCIETITKDNKPCPTCNNRNFTTFHDKRLQRSLYAFQVYCSNKQEGCDWKGELGQLDNHLKLSGGCPMVVIDCDFRHVECDVSLPRRDMPAHLNENLAKHVSLLAVSHSKLERDMKQLSMASLGYIEITMENFEQHKKDKDGWYSPPFYTGPGGYRFCLRVDANGWDAGEGTHVSVFLYLMRGEFDDHLKWPFRGDITVQLVDQEGGEEHHTDTTPFNDKVPDEYAGRVIERERQMMGWGKPQFISHGKLNPKHLKSDCLRFRITKITF